MSYFNRDQQSYMDDLAKIPPEQKCWCGWFRLGECHVCPPGKTSADKRAVWCPSCHNAPPPDGSQPLVHIKGCTAAAGKAGQCER